MLRRTCCSTWPSSRSFIVATAFAWNDGATSGMPQALVVVLHGAGIAMLGLSCWIGGELVYRRHVAMVPDDDQMETAERRRHMTAGGRG